MTKAIKFNLTLDNHPVRDLDDLRTHFNIDDLLSLYHEKVLHRWLDVRGLTAELNQLIAINSEDNKTIASELCRILHSDLTQDAINAAVYPFEFREQQQAQLEKLNEQLFSRNAVIKDYHAGYEKLCAAMIEKAEDYPFLKSAINTLWQDYSQLFTVDFAVFFAKFIEKSPLTLFTMLTNDAYRESELFNNYEKGKLFGVVIGFISPLLKVQAVDYFQSYAGITDGYWKDLEPKGTKCLILKMENGNFIRNIDRTGEELNAEAINGQFIILDGIYYKSNNADHTLIYMVI